MILILTALSVLVACSGSPTPTEIPAPTPTDLPTPPTPDPTADTGPVVPEVDCRHLPAVDGGDVLPSPRAYHGIAFDDLGNLVGGDNTNLLISSGPSHTQILVPNIGTLQQIVYLPSGDLVVARDSGGRIDLVQPNGAVQTLASGIGAYGLTVGPDGMIYTANQSRIDRVDPSGTLSAEVWLPTTVINRPKVLTFNRAGDAVFVGTNLRNGNVFRVDVDSAGDPITPTVLIGQTGGDWHDGIAFDACGNLYINEYNTRTLYRQVHGTDTWAPFVRFNQLGGAFDDLYGHGIEWGSGIGHWPETSAYMPLPYHDNRVGQLDLGVPGRDYNGGNYTVIR